MTSDHTQQQSGDARRRARELSLKRTTPPIDVPGYETQRFLGSGAFGEVWAGIDKNTGRRVAIKFYTHRGGVDWTLLAREVEKLAVLAADRYVVQLLDVGWDSDPPYYVMDYIDNGSLEDLLKEDGALSVHKAIDIFQEIAVGLMHLHGKGVLHCDLKPANVLLDEDEKPRLADFGQSRLSHEQQPALGTLFYMAPEQADLEAVPDARWDVYALGAVLYSMLIGEPPFRNDTVTTQIDSTNSLSDRLKQYRKAIKSAPRPDAHRKISGVDRGLAEIIDRCLAVDPEERFPSVESVLEALKQREWARMRTPLLVMGVVAPIVLLAIMVYLGVTNYLAAIDGANDAVISRVRKSNKFVAVSKARAIRGEVERFFSAVNKESQQTDLRDKVGQLLSADDVPRMLEELNVPHSRKNEVEVSAVRTLFLQTSQRIALENYLKKRIQLRRTQLDEDPQAIRIASMFVLDRHGTILAVAYEQPQDSKSEGRNYSFRTYFHENPRQLPKDTPTSEIQPITKTHLSGAFQSSTTGTWKIGVSTPVVIDEQPQGILVMTIELMHFTPFRDDDQELANGQSTPEKDPYDHFAVLVDGRQGEEKGQEEGTILHHPWLTATSDEQRRDVAKQKKYVVNLHEFTQAGEDGPFIYRDPFGQHEEGANFDRPWIAAMTNVTRLDPASNEPRDTGLRVIVQESYQASVKPLETLRLGFLQRVSFASVVVLLVIAIEWYFVARMLGHWRGQGANFPGQRSKSDSVHSMETISAPQRPNCGGETTQAS